MKCVQHQLLVMVLYFVILVFQRDAHLAWTMESTAKNNIFTTDSGVADVMGTANNIDNSAAFFTWLDTVVGDNMFMDPKCGNGLCEGPQVAGVHACIL